MALRTFVRLMHWLTVGWIPRTFYFSVQSLLGLILGFICEIRIFRIHREIQVFNQLMIFKTFLLKWLKSKIEKFSEFTLDWQGGDVAMFLCVHLKYQLIEIIQSFKIMIIRLICLFRESRNINSMRNSLFSFPGIF